MLRDGRKDGNFGARYPFPWDLLFGLDSRDLWVFLIFGSLDDTTRLMMVRWSCGKLGESNQA
jgi:hypothetical protein